MIRHVPGKRTVQEIEALLRAAQKEYDAGTPKMSDQLFDGLVESLREFNPASPVLAELGVPVTSKTIKHPVPMLSLSKIKSADDARKWIYKHRAEILVQPKYDGVALELCYRAGALVSACLRGDSIYGDNVTLAARLLSGVPAQIKLKATTYVRGEAVMKLDTFNALFTDQYANPRNLVAGAIQAHTLNHAVLQYIDFVAYDLVGGGTMRNRVGVLYECGFTVGFHMHQTTSGFDPAAWEASIKENVPYECDGVVIKLNDDALHAALGATSHHPKWAVALKFATDSAEAQVRGVVWQVSRTGTVTPVVELQAVELSGVSISRATLHNLTRFDLLALSLNDVVLVTRRGGVIPHIEHVVRKGHGPAYYAPKHCPCCHTMLVNRGETLACVNSACFDQCVGTLLYWAHETGMLGWGRAMVERAYSANMLKTPIDFYRLNELSMRRAGFGPGETRNLLAEIEKTRVLEPEVFWNALGIEHLGKSTTTKLMPHVTSGADIIGRLCGNEIPGIGDTMRSAIIAGINQRMVMIEELLEEITLAIPDAPPTGPWVGKSFVFTGKLSDMERSEAQALVREHGGTAPPSVTKQTTYLVVGGGAKDEQRAKRDKAEKYGVTILEEATWVSMLASLV